MGVPRGTTPTLLLTFTEQNLDFTAAEDVYVTIKYGDTKLTKTGTDLVLTQKTISVFLTQQETLTFPEGECEVQANWTGGGKRAASDIGQFYFSKQLLDEVL